MNITRHFFKNMVYALLVEMSNELLLLMSLLLSFGGALAFFRFFGKTGSAVWVCLCAVFANIEVQVVVKAFGMEQTLGNTLFASSFLATDFLSEFYGKKAADGAVKLGIAASCVFIIFSLFVTRYTPASSDAGMTGLRMVFSNTPRILLASLAAYALAEFLDVKLYHAIWNATSRKTGRRDSRLWLRNNAATLISQAVNIAAFNVGAFFGVYDVPTLLSITASGYVIYIFTSLLDTPFLYVARRMHQRRAGQ